MIRLEGKNGAYVEFTRRGAAVTSLCFPDREGRLTDVVLGYGSDEEYDGSGYYFGATVGRVAGRISGAEFSLDGREYRLIPNEGKDQLHGGPAGFASRVWDCDERGDSVVFSLASPDGDQGFPGGMRVSVTYGFDGNTLSIEYRAVSDRDTLFSPTNHCYFNLEGHDSGMIGAHRLQIAARSVLESAGKLMTGALIPVEGTAFSFLAPRAIGDGLSSPHENMLECGGYDHCYVLEGEGFRETAALASRESGIALRIFTDMPVLVLYTANGIKPFAGKGGAEYDQYGGVCLETQFFPYAPEHPEWRAPILRAGQEFYSRTDYRLQNF